MNISKSNPFVIPVMKETWTANSFLYHYYYYYLLECWHCDPCWKL